jgi:signal transduction histidine kinase
MWGSNAQRGGIARSRQNPFEAGFAGLAVTRRLWALAAFTTSLLVFEMLRPLAFRAPALRATVETAITLCALSGAGLFGLSFAATRRLRDWLLLGALVEVAFVEVASSLVPLTTGLHADKLAAASLVGNLLVAATLAAAVLVPRDKQVALGDRALALAVGGSIIAAALAQLSGLMLRDELVTPGGPEVQGGSIAGGHPLGVVLSLGAVALVVAAAAAMFRECEDGEAYGMPLLAGGFVLLASGPLYYLVRPTLAPDWVAMREGVRLAGFVLILIAALSREAESRRALVGDAVMRERRRMARDLHDGLAQELAFIAAHGERIAHEAGSDDPLAIAARRALAISRGAIADLSASLAPTTKAALRQLAEELAARFEMRIDVEGNDVDLSPSVREDVVRIAREAIVNAAHANARHVVVLLARDNGRCVLRVLDDGCGIGSSATERSPGFGLRSMRERAASLGGRLTAQPAGGRGTELEVVFR